MVVFSEKNGCLSSQKHYKITFTSSGNIKLETKGPTNSLNDKFSLFQSKWWASIWESLLPIGYPDSVSEDYLRYQFWDTTQEFCYALNFALCSSAILKANLNLNNVNSAGEIIFGMALLTLLRDACKKIGPIYFSMAKFRSLDSQHKQWRLVADVLIDLSMLLDILTPLANSFYVIVLMCCTASVLDSLSAVIGGSTRAPLLQHLAKSNNGADLIAKEQCQNCCVNLIFLLFACIFLPKTVDNDRLMILVFLIIAPLHIYTNYRAQATLNIASLNEERLLICLKQFLKDETVPSVKEANERESVIFGFGLKDTEVCGYNLRIGVSLAEVINGIRSNNDIETFHENVFDRFDGKNFIILPNEDHKQMNIILNEKIYEDTIQIFEAYVRAIFTSYHLSHGKNVNAMDLVIDEQLNIFENGMNASGFNTKKVALNMGNCVCNLSKLD